LVESKILVAKTSTKLLLPDKVKTKRFCLPFVGEIQHYNKIISLEYSKVIGKPLKRLHYYILFNNPTIRIRGLPIESFLCKEATREPACRSAGLFIDNNNTP
jgi:hypothetical protein